MFKMFAGFQKVYLRMSLAKSFGTYSVPLKPAVRTNTRLCVRSPSCTYPITLDVFTALPCLFLFLISSPFGDFSSLYKHRLV